jgi:hypothetical protein
MCEILVLPLTTIGITGGTQSRASLHDATVAEYAEVIRLGGELPPVVVFNDGVSDGLFLADGYHRFHAHRLAGAMEIACDVRVGTLREAILYAAGANVLHGLRRSNEDKRRAVMMLLNDEEWSTWTQSKIAEACGVSREFVSRLSVEVSVSCDRSQDSRRTVTRNGTTYEQHTANIGGKAKPAEPPATVVPAPATTTAPPEPTPARGRPVEIPWRFTAAELEALCADNVTLCAPPSTTIVSTDVEALRKQVAELSEALKISLAENEMMRLVIDADDKTKAAMDEAKRQAAIAGSAKCRLSVQSAELLKCTLTVKQWKIRAKKAETSLAMMVKPSAGIGARGSP